MLRAIHLAGLLGLLAATGCNDSPTATPEFRDRVRYQTDEELRKDEPGDMYSFEVPRGVEIAPRVRSGRSYYRYVGQQQYRRHPVPMPTSVVAIDRQPLEPDARIMQSVIIDREGRRYEWDGWVDGPPSTWPETNDEPSGHEAIRDSDSDADSYGHGTKSVVAAPNMEAESLGEPYVARLLSWSQIDCGGSSLSDNNIWESESRQVGSFNPLVQQGVVLIFIWRDLNDDGVPTKSEVGTCTGQLVHDGDGRTNRVLTAAHCVAEDGTLSSVAPISRLRVCTRGNLATQGSSVSCRSVDAVHANMPYFSGTHNVNEDFAVLDVDPDVSTTSRFRMSAADPSIWNQHPTFLHSHDGLALGVPASCDSTETGGQVAMWGNAILFGHPIHHQGHTGQTFFTTSQIRTRFDGSGGASGSAYIYCPNSGGSCSNGGAYIIGLQTTWNSVLKRRVGPRVHVFKTFVENHL